MQGRGTTAWEEPRVNLGMSGKVALVTGGSRGIGRACAESLAAEGCDVMILARTEADLEEAAAAIAGAGGRRVEICATDLRSPQGCEAAVGALKHAFGRLDILVNNAGIIRREPAIEHSDESWDTVLEVDLSSVFRLCRAAGRHLIERGQGGKIINVASLLAFQGGINVASYAAAKGGVMQLTKALANEWASHGINVNAIAPGYMETDNTAALRADERRNRQITERIPAGRWGTAQDLAGAVIYLASRASDYVNGHVLVVDGGWMGR
jgi:2-dehydro-3-deoxy-D-gluconate 5-dehydrogenase